MGVPGRRSVAACGGRCIPGGGRGPGRRWLREQRQPPSTASCFAKHGAAGQFGSAPGAPANPAVAAAWTLPGGNLQNTRDVASPITSSDVTKLGVAWCVPVESTGEAAAPGWPTDMRPRRWW